MTLINRSLVATALLTVATFPVGLVGSQAAQAPQAARYYNPKFSADGTMIIFESTRDGKYTLYSINTDGTGLKKLTNSLQNDEVPSWSPDGKRIAFIRELGKFHKVFVMDANGLNPRQVSTGDVNDNSPTFSPDNKYVAWSKGSMKPEDWREIAVAAVDGSGEHLITSGPGNDQSPVWISNTRLIYVTEFPPKVNWMDMTPEDHAKRRASEELMAVDMDGSRPAQLTKNTNADYGPSFATAIGRVFFRTDRGGKEEFWSVRPDGTDPRREDAALGGGTISADGKLLTYAKIVGDRSGIFVRAVGSTVERELIGGEKPPHPAPIS